MVLGTINGARVIRMGLVACDYITCLGLAQIFSDVEGMDVLNKPESQLLDLSTQGELDLVLVDAGSDSSVLDDTCQRFLRLPNPPMVLVLGELPYSQQERLLAEGVYGFLILSRIAEDLPALLRVIIRGGLLVLNRPALDVIANRHPDNSNFDKGRIASLNPRERSVAELVTEGRSNAEIALTLHLSSATVKQIISTIIAKLGVFNRVQVAVAMTRGQFM